MFSYEREWDERGEMVEIARGGWSSELFSLRDWLRIVFNLKYSKRSQPVDTLGKRQRTPQNAVYQYNIPGTIYSAIELTAGPNEQNK